MIRKFECWNCKKQFDADDKEWVECPYCHSDNVDYKTWHINPWIFKSVALLTVFVAVVAVLLNLKWSSPSYIDKIASNDDSITIEDVKVDSVFIAETGLMIPPSLIASDLNFTDNGYNFSVNVKNPPSLEYYFVVLDAFEEKVISKSEDGKFDAVPCSESEGGSYRVAIRSSINDSTLATLDVPGFIKQMKVNKKMSVQELQSRIDSRDKSLVGIGENDYLAPDYKLVVAGLSKDAVNIPKIIAEVFEKLDMETWTSVKVKSLEYDELNRISLIHIAVVDNSDF